MQKKTSIAERASVTPRGTSTSRDAAPGVRNKSRGRRTAVPFTAEELRKISEEISLREWPAPTSSRLELMEIDPWNVHAYWHIRASDMARCRARLPRKGVGSRLVLRFYDVSSVLDQNGLHDRFDIEVADDSHHWYVNLWRDGKHYSAEIGLRADDGSFEALATSNQVAIPRAYPSADLDFYLVNVHVPSAPDTDIRSIPRASNDDLLRDLFPQRLLSGGEFPWADQNICTPLNDEVALPELDEVEPEKVGQFNAYPELDRNELENYGTQTSQAKEIFLDGAQLPVLGEPPAGTVAPAGIEFDVQLAAIPKASLAEDGLPLRKAESGNVPAERPEGPGIDIVREGGRGHRLVALEMCLGHFDSSPSATEDACKIEASLVIEGQCPPGTDLLLFGQEVHLETDGTFSIKQPLDRGPELLEFMYRLSSRKIKE